MLKIVVLVCSTSIDHAACDPTNALDVVRAMEVSTPQQCGFMAQALLAQSSLVPDPSKHYIKVVCLRTPTQTASASLGR